MRFRQFLPAILLLLAPPLQARIWTVEADGSGDAPTIQAAIDSASSGDEVSVQPGTYFENIDFLGKDLWVHAPLGPATTVIDGSGLDSSVVTIRNGETRAARLEGFTIQGGRGNGRPNLKHGGGIFVLDASPQIIGNLVINNTAATGWGGGIALDTLRPDVPQIEPLVQGNRFESNSCGINGGGMVCWGARAEVYDNVFVSNEAAFDGGGIYLAMDGAGSLHLRGNQFWENIAQDHGGGIECGVQGQAEPLLIEYNLFVRNEAYGNDGPSDSGTGGAISIRGWGGVIRNNTFSGNVGTGGNGCTGGGIMVSSGTYPLVIEDNLFYGEFGCAVTCRSNDGADGAEVRHNLFWQNTPADISTPADCDFGVIEDNLYEDPLLCGPETDNFTVSVDSPALSASPLIGVWLSPGCGPGVPIESSTWGRLKLRFRD